MVCIAAFIILILVGLVVAVLSIFNRDLGRKYLKVLKKSWHCFSRRVTLRKCDTNFSDDVKTLLLKKVIVKRPKLVKPLSVTIEVASILIVIVSAWSLIEATKAGLALWVFGTCNVSQPESCALGSEVCSLDGGDLNWFEEWGEIFENIPDRLKTWKAYDYMVTPIATINDAEIKDDNWRNEILDIMDPGCAVCAQSYRNQLADSSLENRPIYVMLYPIKLQDGSYKFKNSGLIVQYYHALLAEGHETAANRILARLFTEENADGVNWQIAFNSDLSAEDAEKTLRSWLKEWGLSSDDVKKVENTARSAEIQEKMDKIADMVENQVKAKGIPTLIYDGKKHMGLYKN